MADETSIGGSRREFPSTLWTVVLDAKDRSGEALEELIRVYWKPVYFYIRRWGTSVEEAKDLCQDFFTELLERDSLKEVSREKGKFRTFLLAVVKHFLINQAERAHAKKRGGGRATLSLDFQRAETEYSITPAAKETPERTFTRHWALQAMSRALEKLSRTMDAATFEALKPHLAGGPPYKETAKKLGIPLSRLNNLVHATRCRYRELLRDEVAGSVSDPELIEEEVKDLLNAVKS
jgi:RNA polymerase sigma-70 factor (ECF subfamily)